MGFANEAKKREGSQQMTYKKRLDNEGRQLGPDRSAMKILRYGMLRAVASAQNSYGPEDSDQGINENGENISQAQILDIISLLFIRLHDLADRVVHHKGQREVARYAGHVRGEEV